MSIEVTTRHAIDSTFALQPFASAVRKDEMAYRAGALKQPNAVDLEKANLDRPQAKVDDKIRQVLSKLDLDTAMLLLIWQANKDAKHMYMTLRSIESQASLESKKAQVAEMHNGGNWMIAGAVMSGVTGLLGSGMSVAGFSSSLESASRMKRVNSDITGLEKKLAAIDTLKPAINKADIAVDVDLKPKLKDMSDAEFFAGFDRHRLEGSVAQSKARLEVLGERQKKTEQLVEQFKAHSMSINGVVNSSLQAKQAFIQGDGKEHDIDANEHDGNKQKAADIIRALEDSQKELSQLMKEITESVNQAMRAASGVA